MLSRRGSALAWMVCVCAVVLACGSSAVASGYFPDVLSCGLWPGPLIPPADVLAQAAPAPPVPLFAESLQSLAASAIAPRWLPDGSEDTSYLEHGDGAYRAQTAHLCKIYERSGYTVILKGFAGGLVAIVEPVPVNVTREAHEELLEAAEHADPCEYLSPYHEDGAPAAVVSMFASIRDELLAPAAHPVNADNWNRMVKGISVVRGGLWLNYSVKGPINDPGVDPVVAANPSNYSAVIWTNGTMLTVALDRNSIVRSNLYRQLQPIVDLSMEDLRLPYVSRMAAAGEWTDADGNLVASQQQASHQKLYFDLGNGLHWMGLVQNPTSGAQIEEAAWLCLARSSVGGIAGLAYPYWINHQGSASPDEVLQRLRETRARHLAALDRLEDARCPGALTATRNSLLSALRVSRAIWDAALPKWESALSSSSEGPVDWEALRATVNAEIASKGLPVPPVGWDWGRCWETISSAEAALGIRTENSIYGP